MNPYWKLSSHFITPASCKWNCQLQLCFTPFHIGLYSSTGQTLIQGLIAPELCMCGAVQRLHNTPSIPSALSHGHCRLSALLGPAAVPGTISHSFSHSPSSTTSTEPFTVQFMNAQFLFWPTLKALSIPFIFILPAEFKSCLTKICKSSLI